MYLTIFIITYILSAILNWRYLHLAYNRTTGIWSTISPNIVDLLIVLLPIFNLGGIFMWMFSFPTRKYKNNNKNLFHKLFRIK